MSNACISRFSSIHKAAVPFPGRTYHGIVFSRNFSTLTAPCISPSIPLSYPPPSLVSVACLTQSDAPQRSDEWFALRKDKLTTSTFSTALGFWKGNRRYELWHEKMRVPRKQPLYLYEVEVRSAYILPSPDPTCGIFTGYVVVVVQLLPSLSKSAMDWGVLMEAVAIERYKIITGRDVSALGFAVHSDERLGWVGASPDGLLGSLPGGGILEVKCPYNKGKPEKGLPWSTMPFYYVPQVQGQMEIMDRDWVDVYCWTPNGSAIFRVYRDRSYWELMHGILWEFWWENVVPAREALLMGNEEGAVAYKPTSTHKKTGLVISRSLKLAGEAKMLCRDIAGHVEFFR